MHHSTAVKKRLTGILWLAIFFCLLPFLLLPFLNNMAADDFNFYHLYRTYGFWGAQEFIYRTWAGRYTTTFLSGALVTLDLPAHYYWLPCLLLFVATWCAIFFLLTTLHSLLPGRPFTRGSIIRTSFLVFILFLYVQAEIATGFYWFSSAIVYQPSFILFLVFAGVLVKRLLVTGAAPSRDALLLLLILLIIGCNEMAAVVLFLSLAALVAGFSYYRRRPAPGYLWLYLGVALAMCITIVITSGVISVRHRLMNTGTSYFSILPVVFFQFIASLFAVFKEPLFWFSCTALFLFGACLARDGGGIGPFAVFRERKVFLPGLLLLLVVILLSLTTVMMGSKGSLPPRALNNLTGLLTGGLLALSFLAGIRKGAVAAVPGVFGLSPALLTAMAAILLLASVNYRDAWKTVLSGYFYHAVYADRDRQLAADGRRHLGTSLVLSYQEAREDKIRQVFPHGIFETVHTLLLEKPPLIYYYDGAATRDRAYCLYYGLDSILVKK